MTVAAPQDQDARSSLESELNDLMIDTLFTARGCQVAGNRWMVVSDFLGLPASMLSALLAGGAGVNVLVSENLGISAGLAFASAIITSASGFLQPQKRSEQYLVKGNKILSVRNRAKLLLNVELKLGNSIKTVYGKLEALRAEYDALLLEEPLQVPRWAYETAKKNIEDGESDYILKRSEKE